MSAYYNEYNFGYYRKGRRRLFQAYVIVNDMNEKAYIGVTTRGLRRRWVDHVRAARDGVKTALYDAMRKYGSDAFRLEHIASAFSIEGLKYLEQDLIVQYMSVAPHGYNLTFGGDGVCGLPAEIVARTAAKNKGRKQSEGTRRLIGQASKGHVVTEKTRAAISASRHGQMLSVEHRAKLSLAKLGKKLPPRSSEHSAKISAGLVKAHAKRKASGCQHIITKTTDTRLNGCATLLRQG